MQPLRSTTTYCEHRDLAFLPRLSCAVSCRTASGTDYRHQDPQRGRLPASPHGMPRSCGRSNCSKHKELLLTPITALRAGSPAAVGGIVRYTFAGCASTNGRLPFSATRKHDCSAAGANGASEERTYACGHSHHCRTMPRFFCRLSVYGLPHSSRVCRRAVRRALYNCLHPLPYLWRLALCRRRACYAASIIAAMVVRTTQAWLYRRPGTPAAVHISTSLLRRLRFAGALPSSSDKHKTVAGTSLLLCNALPIRRLCSSTSCSVLCGVTYYLADCDLLPTTTTCRLPAGSPHAIAYTCL